MKKTVCYFMTRNIYGNVLPSLKSLLKNGCIDQVYLFIEDDDIGFWLPDNVKCVNVSGQKWFSQDGPNYNCKWTYMVMMKTVVCWLLPGESRALTLDLDTIVRGSLNDLWQMDMGRNCVAGAKEPYWSFKYGYDYINGGVLMWDLNKMRAGKAEKVVKALNEKKYNYVEQDCISEQLQGEIRILDSVWNKNNYVMPTDRKSVKILHFADYGQERFMQQPEVKTYLSMPWEKVCNSNSI